MSEPKKLTLEQRRENAQKSSIAFMKSYGEALQDQARRAREGLPALTANQFVTNEMSTVRILRRGSDTFEISSPIWAEAVRAAISKRPLASDS